jgi:hypothetical protein
MKKMTAFQKAEALAGRRYDRDKLLAMVDEVTTHFRMPNSFERSKMRAVCRYLADALDRCSGSTLQQRWNDFEKRFWPRWKAGVDRRGREYWTWGARVLISARMIAPSLDLLSDLRVNQWIAHLPEDHPLAQQHTSLLQATNSITWTSAHSRQLAVSNGLRILLVRGYDSLHHIKDDDLKLLAVRWSKGTDALDAALCSLGVFSRTPKRGSARHGRRQRMTASELVENAGVPDRFRQIMILYLETYEARVSDVYRTLRHKVIALAHFWRFIRDRHPDVKRCSQILPRHVRDYIPHAIRRAREVQRGPGAGDEVRPTAHSWLIDLRVFFSDICAWATEPTGSDWREPLVPLMQDWFKALKAEDAGHRAAGLLVADSLLTAFGSIRPGDHFGSVQLSTAEQSKLRSALQALGATFEPGYADGFYGYSGDWLDQAKDLDLNSEGGRLALVTWMSRGGGCQRSGADDFRKVISLGETLLAKKIDASTAAQVHFMVGDAYSDMVAIAGGVDPNGDYASADLGNDAESRVKALQHYRSGLALDNTSDDAKNAWRQAWHLAAGLVPGTRYTCFGD